MLVVISDVNLVGCVALIPLNVHKLAKVCIFSVYYYIYIGVIFFCILMVLIGLCYMYVFTLYVQLFSINHYYHYLITD